MSMQAKSKLRQNIWRLVLITIAGSVIYGLPYFRSYYYDIYLDTYHLTNTQMGMFGSMFGILGMISYLFGGVVADMFSPRKLMSLSMVLTGLGGLLHLMNPSYGMLLFIYLLWGLTSLFAFWPSLLKVLREIASDNEQSKAYGFMDGGRGIVNVVHLAITLAIFNYLSKKISNLAGLNGVIIFYSVVVILLGILLFIIMKDTDTDSSQHTTEKYSFKQIITVLKIPAVWILSLILCCTYTMNIAFYYFTPYATSTFGITATAGAMITMLAQYIRPIAAFSGGIIADKIGRAKIMNFTFSIMAISTFVIVFFNNLNTLIFITLCIVIYFGMYAGYSIVFSMMNEGGIPINVSGTAIGLICTLGYLPEVFVSPIAGTLLDKMGEQGYKPFLTGVGIIMLIGLFSLSIWRHYLKTLKKK